MSISKSQGKRNLFTVERLSQPALLAPIAAFIALICAIVATPPMELLVLVMSIPFFGYAANSKWKDCIVWIIITVPFQYYFNLWGLALTHTELYLFVFSGAYLLSNVILKKSFLIPSTLAIPAFYGVSQFTPLVAGNPELVKHGLRTIVAVFFYPQHFKRSLQP